MVDPRIIEDYIKAIDAPHFQAFCDRLLVTLYPEDFTPVRAGGNKGDMKNDGYCFSSRTFFQAHATRGESIAKTKTKMRSDFEGCIRQWEVYKFIYITNDTQIGEIENEIDQLRSDYNTIQIETWSPLKISNLVGNLPDHKIEYVIERQLTRRPNISSDISLLSGVSLLKPPKTEAISATQIKYQDYLQSNNLPYISRNEFKDRHPAESFITESMVFEKTLDEGALYDGCIIFGEGGIGKTRFMLEIGQMALKKGWIVLRIHPTVASVEILKPYLSRKEKYLLLFDYIEENESFNSDIITQLKSDDEELVIKVAANCRYTYRSSSKFPGSETFFQVELKTDDTQEAYEAFVTSEILKGLKEDIQVKDETFFKLKPSFAVFLRYLLYSHKISTNDIREVQTFKVWIKKRLCWTLGINGFSQMAPEIAYLLGIMPAAAVEIDRFYTDINLRSAIQKLIADGWLEEYEKDSLRVIHDTITDEILIIHLELRQADMKREIRTFLSFAVNFGMTYNWLRSLERIVGQPGMPDKKFFFAFISDCISKEPQNFTSLIKLLGVTSLLEEGNRIDLFLSNINYFRKYIEDISFGGPLSFALNLASQGKIEEDKARSLRSIFNIWFEKNKDFSDYPDVAYRILSTYIKYFGIDGFVETYFYKCVSFNYFRKTMSYPIAAFIKAKGQVDEISALVIKYLEKHSEENNSFFVISSWLNHKGSLKQIEPFIVRYLNKNAEDPSSSYIFGNWIENNGPLEKIQDFILRYLAKNIHKANARIVLKNWFDGHGPLEPVSRFILEYMEIHEHEQYGAQVLPLWLNNKGSLDTIRPYVLKYLEKHAQSSWARFVLTDWLKNKGELKFVEPFVIEYLSKNHTEDNSRFVITFWLDHKGPLHAIQPLVIQYLEHQATDPNASFVLQSWFENGGPLEPIEPFLLQFLEKNAEEIHSSFVLGIWLHNNGNLEVLEPFVVRFLKKNAQDLQTSFVMEAWFNNHGQLEPVQHFLIQYLEVHAENIYASFALKAWLDGKGAVELISPYVIRYLKKNAALSYSQFVLSAWLEVKAPFETVRTFIIEYLQNNLGSSEARFVITGWLANDGPLEIIQPYVLAYLNKNGQDLNNSYLFEEWFLKNGPLEPVKPFILQYLEKNSKSPYSLFVLTSWLLSGGPLPEIEPFIIECLDEHAETINSQFLLAAWLNSKADKNIVKSFLIRYLENHAATKDAQFPLSAWVRQMGPLDELLGYYETYLETNGAGEHNSHFYYSWLKNRYSFDIVKDHADQYLSANSMHPSSQKVIAPLANYDEGLKLMEKHMPNYFLHNSKEPDTQFVITAWLKNKGSLEVIKPYMFEYLKYNMQTDQAAYVYTAWLHAEGDPQVIWEYIRSWFSIRQDEKLAKTLSVAMKITTERLKQKL